MDNPAPSSTTDTEFAEMAGAFQAFDPEVAKLRSIISLNEAIRLGTLEARNDSIIYEDFASNSKTLRPSFSMPIKDVNTHIYTVLAQSKAVKAGSSLANAKKAKQKILKDPEALLTEEELLAYQSPFILGFLSLEDLNVARREKIADLQEDDDVSKNMKQRISHAIETATSLALMARNTYLAAIATQNAAAINEERKNELYAPFAPAKPLMQEIQILREHARQHTHGPSLSELLGGAPGRGGEPVVIAAPDCRQS